MLSWTRPPPHLDFHADATALLRDLRADATRRGGVPLGEDFKNREIWTGSWKRRQQSPGLHKQALVGHVLGWAKCVYCERIRDVSRELDVEHYRPKGCVTEWRGEPPIVSDTPPPEFDVEPGYWWLAFTWENYALSCKACNGAWKRNLFPVEAPRMKCTEGAEVSEQPLLLEPGTAFRTRDHFRWTVDGIMEPISAKGRATIITCGLNRKELTALRLKVAVKVKTHADAFVRAFRRQDREAMKGALQEIGELGARSEEFTSMVRWMVEENLGRAWESVPGLPL